ncbi:1-aminocyclopropane-1-carboxylate oxidase [Actinidia chinensis var. chinensis]|uniref:1-aminocyclopropane-1-carboxylate oxidase n=1 Tax=Actinidia chinensis var. chinensis TaxID=1590841 RepID=A0A2R6PLE9_ACTCC|nr:1-aminocyclopropane-1-carboxylate oxidase [Actinidia chinensis var. chinensis]
MSKIKQAVDGTGEASAEPSPDHYDRLQELKAFDESKSGVKGLADAGISKVPRIFLRPADELASDYPIFGTHLKIPVIDFGIRRSSVVDGVRRAAESLGFFQVVNHGVPTGALEGMLRAAGGFHELPREVKMMFYSRELERRVKFGSNFDLYQSRDVTMDYSKQIKRLGTTLFELLSEALGLKPDHLLSLDCAKGHAILSHYYPACPEPELTMGTTKHSDPDFLTILLQDGIGGLQVLHQSQWVNVSPVPGALVVNIGDLLQLMSNDKFKSVEHRVLVNHDGPRVSVACFFTPHLYPSTKMYGPIKDLLSEDNPPDSNNGLFQPSAALSKMWRMGGCSWKREKLYLERDFGLSWEDRGILVEPLCPRCHQAQETIDHLLFSTVRQTDSKSLLMELKVTTLGKQVLQLAWVVRDSCGYLRGYGDKQATTNSALGAEYKALF